MKKFIAIMLVCVLSLGIITGCSKNEPKEETSTNTEQSSEVSNTESNSTNENSNTNETNNENSQESMVGAWEVVNLPYEQASDEVKAVYEKAMGSNTETYTPKTFVGSQLVAGMNYAFIVTDTNNLEREVYIYQDLEGNIANLEIGEPNESLPQTPNVDNSEQVTPENSNSTENSNSSENSSSAENSNSSESSNSSEDTSSSQPPANAQEAFVEKYGSTAAAESALSSENMKTTIQNNDIIYTYQYQDDYAEETLKIMAEEIKEVIKANESNYIETVKKLSSDTGFDVSLVMKYLDKAGNEIVTVIVDKHGVR